MRRPPPASVSGGRLDVRANVWTPAIAAASAAASGVAPSARPAGAGAGAVVARVSSHPSILPATRADNAMLPAVKARAR